MQIAPQQNPFVASKIEGGGKISIGTTPVPVTFATLTPTTILISADSGNTAQLYVGGPNITSSGANAVTYLNAGDSIAIDYGSGQVQLFVVAASAGQNFWKGGFY